MTPAPDRHIAAHWRAAMLRNAERPPAERDHFLLPYDPAEAEAFGKPLPVVPNEIV